MNLNTQHLWSDRVTIGSAQFGNTQPLALIAGINVIESPKLAFDVAEHLADVCRRLDLSLVFKASWIRPISSIHSFRGIGLERGLQVLSDIQKRWSIPVVTDIHESWQAEAVGDVVDLVQIPAFLSRQTDLIHSAVKTGKPLIIKDANDVAL